MWYKKLLVFSERSLNHDKLYLKFSNFRSTTLRNFQTKCRTANLRSVKMSGTNKGKEIYKRFIDKRRRNRLAQALETKLDTNNTVSNTYSSDLAKVSSYSSFFGNGLKKVKGSIPHSNSVTSRTFPLCFNSHMTPSSLFMDIENIISLKNYSTTNSVTSNNELQQNSTSSVEKSNEDHKHTEILLQNNLNSKDGAVLGLMKIAKNVLHNYFSVISKELDDKTLTVAPQYKKVKGINKGSSLWCCSYNIKWPEKKSFSHVASTKQEASSKAAQMALSWLFNNKKINNRGMPLTYDKEVVKSTTKYVPALLLDKNIEEILETVKSIYKNQLIASTSDNNEEDNSSYKRIMDFSKEWPDFKQIKSVYGNMDSYIIRNRVKLPISDFKEEILEKIKNNRAVILKGEPGCGKSTRVPQYILEEWAAKGIKSDPCRIIVTQPRRIAAVSLADRVASERSETLGRVVGYQVRFDAKFNNSTGRILYCTSGILLRHLQSDPNLSDSTHVILDEAHERDVNVDLLMNLLKKALLKNDKLKIIIMSATIDTKLFQNYFDDAPVISIPGFTYPVKQHFIEENSPNFSKTLKFCASENPSVACEEVVELIEKIHEKKAEGGILCFLPGWEEIDKVRRLLGESTTMSVMCLHSRMNIADQKKVFSRTPPGIRKVILSTNIAETSVTVNDVVYVIDTGIHKEQHYDSDKGMYCLGNNWISKSNMTQRKGRAGRVQPGESYHLYPHSVYEKFSQFSVPEILRTSLTKIVLDSKVASGNMNAVEFLSQLPTPPDLNATKRAVNELKELELLDEEENLTPLGYTLSEFQLEPKFSKAMVNSLVYRCVTPVIDIVTIFSAETELFSKGLTNKDKVKKSKETFSQHSDHLALMRIFEKWRDYYEYGNVRMTRQLTESLDLMEPKLQTIEKLRRVHFDYLKNGFQRVLPISDNFSDNDNLVLGVLLSGVGTILQHRNWDIVKGRFKKAKCFLTLGNSQKATITSESVNFKKSHFPSDYFLYLNEMMSNIRRTVLIRETSIISPLTVLLFKNKPLLIEEVSQESTNIQSDKDEVLLKLSETDIQFKCLRKQAVLISNCKEALQTGMKYYINRLTTGREISSEVDENWLQILNNINTILNTQTYD